MAVAADRAASALARWSPVAVALAAMVAYSASRVLHLTSADGLLPVLMSTDHLTWFYWGQDRLANVVPLAASVVQEPRLNLGVQMVLVGVGWYGLIAVFAGLHLRIRGRRPAPGTIAVTVITSGLAAAWVLPAATEQAFVFEQLYAFATLLLVGGVVGVLQARRRWQVLGMALLLAAAMVNPAMALAAPVIIVAYPVFAWRAAARALCASIAALAVAMIASQVLGTGEDGSAYSDFSPGRTLDNFTLTVRRMAFAGDWGRARLVLAGSLAVLVAGVRARGGGRIIWTSAMAVAFAFAWTVLFSGNLWVERNQLQARYFFPVFGAGLLVLTGAATECAAQLASLVRRRRPAVAAESARGPTRPPVRWILAGLTVAAAPLTMWLVSRVEIDALVEAEPHVEQLASSDTQFVAGNYWLVWPTVVEARAQGRSAWGIAPRVEPIRSQVRSALSGEISRNGSARIMCLGVDAQGCLVTTRSWTGVPLTLLMQVGSDPLLIVVR